MLELFYNYIDYLLHPIRNHSFLATKRMELERMRRGRLFALVDDSFEQKMKLDFVSFAMISWVFVMIFGFYSLLSIHLGINLSQDLLESGYFPGIGLSSLFQKKVLLMGILFEIVFFPFSAWIYVKFWKLVIKFFTSIFDREADAKVVDDIVNNSLVSNFFLVIPIIGSVIKKVSSVFYIFIGLKHNLRFTTAQSFIVIMSPVLLVGLSILFMIMYISLIISLI